jgi:hypothetical protein
MSGPRRLAARADATAPRTAASASGYSPRIYRNPTLAPVATGCDRHRLDDGERVAFEDHPVLERAGFRLVGVAHEVMRLRRLCGDRGPFAPRREGGATAAHQLRRRDLGDDRLTTDLDGSS